MKMKFDLLFLQTIIIKKPRATVPNPGMTPKTILTGLPNTIYPISPMIKSNPPTKRYKI